MKQPQKFVSVIAQFMVCILFMTADCFR